jgi:DNA (cytosine-5)-methyltransferase 1
LGKKRKLFSCKFLYDNKVSATITANGQYLRFDVPGTPNNKDFITFQTFPRDYDFCGQNVQYICGMSVPPIMMKKISEQVYLQLFKEDNGNAKQKSK